MRVALLLTIVLAFVACAGSDKTGTACSSDGDCGSGFACVYKIDDGCAAKPTCQPLPTGTLCGAGILYCDCSGGAIGVGCGSPSGYASVPVIGLKQGLTCGSSDAGGE